MIYGRLQSKNHGKAFFGPKTQRKNTNQYKKKREGFLLSPTTDNVTSKPLYGDNLAKQMNEVENKIDEIYKSNISVDLKNYAILALMRKLKNLNKFRKAKMGGVFRISTPPDKPTTTPLPKEEDDWMLDEDYHISRMFDGENEDELKKAKKIFNDLKMAEKKQKSPQKTPVRVNTRYNLRADPKKTKKVGRGLKKRHRPIGKIFKFIKWNNQSW